MGNLPAAFLHARHGLRDAASIGRAGEQPEQEAMAAASSDLHASLSSGYGGGGHQFGYVHEEECPEGIDEDLALLLTAAAIAAGAFVIYRQVTIEQMGRRKRDDQGPSRYGIMSAMLQGK